jgi:hypothetical protein
LRAYFPNLVNKVVMLCLFCWLDQPLPSHATKLAFYRRYWQQKKSLRNSIITLLKLQPLIT